MKDESIDKSYLTLGTKKDAEKLIMKIEDVKQYIFKKSIPCHMQFVRSLKIVQSEIVKYVEEFLKEV